jgi:hypothetical protein
MNPCIRLLIALGIIGSLCHAPADQGVYRTESRLKGKLFKFVVMESQLQNVPKWETKAEHPPLSPRKAMSIAKQKARELLPAVYDWDVSALTLQRTGAEGNWIYVVKATERPNQLRWNNPAWINIIVLMDGSAVEPTIAPATNDTHAVIEITPE